jgi:MrcB-like, N-terminal domain
VITRLPRLPVHSDEPGGHLPAVVRLVPQRPPGDMPIEPGTGGSYVGRSLPQRTHCPQPRRDPPPRCESTALGGGMSGFDLNDPPAPRGRRYGRRMQAELEETLLLQDDWSAQNTDPMRRRGVLVRQEIPRWLRGRLPLIKSDHDVLDDLAAEGRDGTGLKTEIPWSRVYSASRSRSATLGWYVVYLFSAFGDRVYLSLNQGTTRWEGGEFKPRPAEELAARVRWARDVLGISARDDLGFDISLEARRSDLGRQYELGNVTSLTYELNAIPEDDQLAADLEMMVGWLAKVYAAEETSLNVPGEPAAEIADALVAIRQAASDGRRTGHGFRLNTAEKLAIERQAVAVVSDYYESLGYAVEDVGSTESFDLDVVRDAQRLSVEVKGTTSVGAEVILTPGEVDHHRSHYPNNCLAIVHSIGLDRTTEEPRATGGTLHLISPWTIEDDRLVPMAYKYSTGLA